MGNPAGYIAGIERNGYTQPLYTAKGDEIKNPVAYLAAAEKRAAGGDVSELRDVATTPCTRLMAQRLRILLPM